MRTFGLVATFILGLMLGTSCDDPEPPYICTCDCACEDSAGQQLNSQNEDIGSEASSCSAFCDNECSERDHPIVTNASGSCTATGSASGDACLAHNERCSSTSQCCDGLICDEAELPGVYRCL